MKASTALKLITGVLCASIFINHIKTQSGWIKASVVTLAVYCVCVVFRRIMLFRIKPKTLLADEFNRVKKVYEQETEIWAWDYIKTVGNLNRHNYTEKVLELLYPITLTHKISKRVKQKQKYHLVFTVEINGTPENWSTLNTELKSQGIENPNDYLSRILLKHELELVESILSNIKNENLLDITEKHSTIVKQLLESDLEKLKAKFLSFKVNRKMA